MNLRSWLDELLPILMIEQVVKQTAINLYILFTGFVRAKGG